MPSSLGRLTSRLARMGRNMGAVGLLYLAGDLDTNHDEDEDDDNDDDEDDDNDDDADDNDAGSEENDDF